MNIRSSRYALAVLFASLTPIVTTSTTRPQPAFQTDVACNEPALPDTFSSRGEIVELRLSVTDDHRNPIACLTREHFQVREDGQLQAIGSFSDADLPVTVGLIVDLGNSTAATQTELARAGLTFARASRIEDEFFALTFNDTVHDVMSADLPFTHQPAVLQDALLQKFTGGGSALYDAVTHGLDYAARGRLDQRVLIVISAGRDTASRSTFPQLVDRVAVSPTVIYTIGILDRENAQGAPEGLKRLASLSGGEAFVAKAPNEVSSILEWIARDIRTSYTIGYVPPNAEDGNRFRTLEIRLARANASERLRYREGYVSGLR